MSEDKTVFPSTEAEREYVDAAQKYKSDLRKLFAGVSEYTPGTSSDRLSELSALLGKRKKESNDAFDKITTEVVDEIDEEALIQQEKLLERKGGETS